MTEVNTMNVDFKKYHGFTKSAYALITHLHDVGYKDGEIHEFLRPMIDTLILQSGNRECQVKKL